jgi:outer membrane protein OmpA-like peptidoglycan-associated protein
MNILDLIKSQVGAKGMESIASMLGESVENTQLASNSSMATILASLMQQAAANNGQGAAGILDMITKGNHNGSIFDNLSGLLGNTDAASNLRNNGGNFISSLLGNKTSGIVDLISSISGIKGESVNSLLSMAAPLVLGMLGKQSAGGGVSGLLNLLMGQSSFVKTALPTGISSLLGFSNFDASSVLNAFKGDVTAPISNKVNEAKTEAANAVEEGSTNWLPWIIGALGLLAALWYFKGCGDKSNEMKNAAAAVEAKAKMMQDSLNAYTKKMAAEAANALTSFKFSDGTSISFEKGSIEDDMIMFINDKAAAIDKNKWFNFEGLNFDTGKATLQAGSETKLANVAAIMKAFPTVKIKIGGYTDNVGNAASNKKLSDARSKTVMAELVKRGVAAARMEAEGYGQEHPVADNATEEGKAKNRRIDISVRAK